MSEREVMLTRIARWTDRGGITSPAGSAALAAFPQISRMGEAEELGNRDSEKPGAATKADDPQAFPMSSGQLRVWFTEQVIGMSAANNLSVGLRLSGSVDTAALELGLQIVVGKGLHHVLQLRDRRRQSLDSDPERQGQTNQQTNARRNPDHTDGEIGLFCQFIGRLVGVGDGVVDHLLLLIDRRFYRRHAFRLEPRRRLQIVFRGIG